MRLIRGEDRCYCIIGRLIVVLCFSHCYHRSIVGAVRLQHCVVCIPLLRPHHFALTGPMCCERLRVSALLYEAILIVRRVLSRAARQ